jgi:hypothetical protein
VGLSGIVNVVLALLGFAKVPPLEVVHPLNKYLLFGAAAILTTSPAL